MQTQGWRRFKRLQNELGDLLKNKLLDLHIDVDPNDPDGLLLKDLWKTTLWRNINQDADKLYVFALGDNPTDLLFATKMNVKYPANSKNKIKGETVRNIVVQCQYQPDRDMNEWAIHFLYNITVDKHMTGLVDDIYEYTDYTVLEEYNGIQIKLKDFVGPRTLNQVAGSPHKYQGRHYKVRTGSKGGRYILVKGKKIYIKHIC